MNYDDWKLDVPEHYHREIHPLDCSDKYGREVIFLHVRLGLVHGTVVGYTDKTVTLSDSFLVQTIYNYEDLEEIK